MYTTTTQLLAIFLAAVLPALPSALGAGDGPQRPLPTPSQRPLGTGQVSVVDAVRGSDANPGTEAAPWRTLAHGLKSLPQGGTLALRGGVYRHRVTLEAKASKDKPLVVRSWPGELAVLDGGIAEFAETPADAWQVDSAGVAGEFRSVRAYPVEGNDRDEEGSPLVTGRFLDSMVPLHGCRFHGDLQSDNPWWNLAGKTSGKAFVYCGPAVWQDPRTGHIHCRLAPTRLPGLGDDNYRGPSDARRVPLCIAAAASGPVLVLQRARHVVLQDIVVRGSVAATVLVEDCADITLDGVTIYGGWRALQIKDTAGLRMVDSACRGLSAPWMYRGALKYRSVEARLLSATSWMPTGVDNRDFEIARCEFTDSEDGVFLGGVRGVRFHHNLVENMTDDGMFLTAVTGWDGHVAGGDARLWQNRFSRCLTTLAFGVGHGRQFAMADRVQTGDGLWITRNVFDFRRPVHYHWPKGPDAPDQVPTFRARFAGDHGSPAWEPMWVYHNTMVGGHTERGDFGISGLGSGMGKGTTRRVLNNILCTDVGAPGGAVPRSDDRFTAAGNLLWSFDPAAARDASLWQAKLEKSSPQVAGQNKLQDPGFVHYAVDWRTAIDLGLKPGSPAVNSGAPVPSDWFDPLRGSDADAPDAGAMPLGSRPWRIGVRGRMDAFGRAIEPAEPPPPVEWSFADDHPGHGLKPDAPRAIVVRGYPAFDAPIIEYLLRRRGLRVEVREREPIRLTAQGLAGVAVLAFDGSWARAKITPDGLTDEDVAALDTWLRAGGKLLLFSQRTDLFKTAAGRDLLARITGNPPRARPGPLSLAPEHPWLAHLPAGAVPAWLDARKVSPLAVARGDTVIAADPSLAVLWKGAHGQGSLIYFGWSIGGHAGDNRRGSTADADKAILDQVRILSAIVELEFRQL